MCNGFNTDSIEFTGSVSNTAFYWTNSDTTIGLTGSGIDSIPSFTGVNNATYPLIGLIAVQPVANNCIGITDTFTITVNPTPNVLPLPDITLCNADSARFNNFSGYVWGTTYDWKNGKPSIGLADSGTGNLPTFAALNDSNVLISVPIKVTPYANNCSGPSDSIEIFIKPTPIVDSISDQVICNSDLSDSIVYISSVAGTTFTTWSDNLYSIGFSGGTNLGIPSFVVKNPADTPIVARIRVLPFANGCLGPADTFAITVNPTPYVDSVVSQLLCENDSTNRIEFKGNIVSSVFNWTNTDTAVGLARTDSGNIEKFQALNPTDTIRTAVVTVAATANNCIGPPRNFTITVKPKPSVDTVSDFTLCNTDVFSTLVFSGPVSDTRFQWSNSDTSIGIVDAGWDSLGTFSANNKGTKPVFSIVKVTSAANGCVGDSLDFTIRVNPTPHLDTIYGVTYCNNETTVEVIFNSSVDSTYYSWQNTNATIGIPVNGTGNIFPFIAQNSGSLQSEGIIKVTPTAYGCTGPSREFNIRVNPTLVPEIFIESRSNGVICDGMVDTFIAMVINEGDNPAYIWKVNGINKGGGTLEFIADSLKDGDIITCQLQSNATCAEPPLVPSNTIKMIVNPNLTPLVNVRATPGTLTKLWKEVEFNASIINGGSSPVYVWKKNGEVLEGITGARYSGKAGVNLLPGDIICVKITSNETCLAVDTAIGCEKAITISNIEKGSRLDYITLHPNPNKGNFILQGNIYTDKEIELKVLDASGKLTYTNVILPVNNTIYSEIKLDDYANGIYFVWLMLEKESKPFRFVISK